MKLRELFKQNFSFQSEIASLYEREAKAFQFRHNLSHPESLIWRHLLYRRTFFFFRNGSSFSVQVELVRFRFAGTNRTFTFYGSLFCAFSHFSKELISQAAAQKDDPFSPAATLVSRETLSRWVSCLASLSSALHSPGYNTINHSLDALTVPA